MKEIDLSYLLILKDTVLEFFIEYKIQILITIILIIFINSLIKKIIKIHQSKIRKKWVKRDLQPLLSSKNINYVLDYTLHKTKINIDLLIIHTSGIYIINRIDLSGYIFATEHINYWVIKKGNKEITLWNPTRSIDRAAEIIEKKIKKKIIPIIIVNDNCTGYIINKGEAMGIKIIRSEEQTKILDQKSIINTSEFELIMKSILNT